MLKLDDFFHLPSLDAAFKQIRAAGPGLLVVAGLEPRAAVAPPEGMRFLPSGRTTIFRIVVDELLAAAPRSTAVLVAEDTGTLRVTGALKRRITTLPVRPPQSIAERIAEGAARRPDLLVIDWLCEQSAPAAVAAAQSGLRVVAQLDTVFRGEGVAQHLADLGVPASALDCLSWAVAVQRLPALCPVCREEYAPEPSLLEPLGATGTFFRSPGCAACANTGRQGDVALFDIFHAAEGTRTLPMERYALELASAGRLALEDVLHFEADHLRRMYHLMAASERALAGSNADLERKIAELNAANGVLQQRTAALMSLQDIGQALVSTTGLGDLVARVCRHARDLCGADRAVLYLLQPQGAEILAVSGWEAELLHRRIEPTELATLTRAKRPQAFAGWPPGVPERHADVEGAELRAGMLVPLVAEGSPVGYMVVHSTRKPRFAPSETALLQTFANGAAASIERAAMIEQLRENLARLEQAQAALVRQERLEREMELARQVQQSVLPHVFPQSPGYTFAACNQPARQVGGDFYDVIALDDEHIGVVIADVSDKGMPAALYMALTRSLILAESRRERSPRAVLLSVHRLLRELGDPHMFVTVFYGVIALRERHLTYARAGHDYPLLFRGESVESLEANGLVLGIVDLGDPPLDEEQVQLEPGDRLVLYTDGLIDVLNEQGRRFDLERLMPLIRRHLSRPPERMCEAIFADLAAYQGAAAQFDDMTVLVVAID